MPQQNYENHPKAPTSLIVCFVGTLLAVILAGIGLFMPASTAGVCLIGTGVVLHGVIAIYALLVMRGYAVQLQDRIIRTEMRLRLNEVLPQELKARIDELTIPHLVGLRFAGDDEVVELTQWVLTEKPEKAKPIKQKVKNWRADNHRV